MRGLTLTEAPRSAIRVELSLTVLLRECPTEVVEVYSIEFGNVRHILRVGAIREVQYTLIYVFCKLSQMVVQEMLIVGVLLEGVEEGHLGSLIWREGLVRVVGP